MHIPSPTERYHLLAHVFFPLGWCARCSRLGRLSHGRLYLPPKELSQPTDAIRFAPPPRFSSPVPEPEIKEKERRLLEETSLGGNFPPKRQQRRIWENNNKKTKTWREGGRGGTKPGLVVCLELVRFRTFETVSAGTERWTGRGRFLNGPPSCCRDNTAACHWQRNARRWPLRHPSWAEKSKENR